MKRPTKIPGEFEAVPPDEATSRRMTALRPYIRQCGDDWRCPWIIKERKLLDYLLVYVPEGQGVFSIEDISFEISGKTLFWVPPDTLKEMRGTSARMRCLYINFDLEYDPARSHWDAPG